MSTSLAKSTIIEAVAATADRDVTGECLDVDGADISPLLEGRGYLNVDHKNDFTHVVGKITAAKKIYDLKDCETPAQIKFWTELKKPFIWTKGEIWSGAGHKEADAISSIYRFYQGKNEAPPIKTSVEGKTLERGPNGQLKKTLIRGLALTLAPCNRATRTDLVTMTKSYGADHLVKSEDAAVPMFYEVSDNPYQKLYELSLAARQLLRKAAHELSDAGHSEEFELKSPKLLLRLKQLVQAHKNI